RQEVIIKRIRPEDDGVGAYVPQLPALEPAAKRLRRKGGDAAVERQSRNQLGNIARHRQLRREINQAGSDGGQPRPDVDIRKRVCAAGTPTSFVVVGEELGLIGGDIDTDRAIALTALAGDAQVERILDVLILPAATDGT